MAVRHGNILASQPSNVLPCLLTTSLGTQCKSSGSPSFQIVFSVPCGFACQEPGLGSSIGQRAPTGKRADCHHIRASHPSETTAGLETRGVTKTLVAKLQGQLEPCRIKIAASRWDKKARPGWGGSPPPKPSQAKPSLRVERINE